MEHMENCCRSNYLKPSTLRPPPANFFWKRKNHDKCPISQKIEVDDDMLL